MPKLLQLVYVPPTVLQTFPICESSRLFLLLLLLLDRLVGVNCGVQNLLIAFSL